MKSLLDEPEHWRQRAREARSLADQLQNPEARGMMLRVAENYDKMARKAELRWRGSKSGHA